VIPGLVRVLGVTTTGGVGVDDPVVAVVSPVGRAHAEASTISEASPAVYEG
jgi:hypothetical protein